MYVQREVDIDVADQIAQLELNGVNVDPEDKRLLPGGETGRSVIGRTDIDGIGVSGLELPVRRRRGVVGTGLHRHPEWHAR